MLSPGFFPWFYKKLMTLRLPEFTSYCFFPLIKYICEYGGLAGHILSSQPLD
jgi:hypothetical protein